MKSAVEKPEPSDDLVSIETLRIFTWINFLTCGIIALFGTGANIINIICFVKLGLRDSINVSFLALSTSDLGSVVTALWSSICVIPGFRESDVPFDTLELQYLTSAWPHMVFTRITSWITALITLERCLCITMPLKVKSILSTRRITIIIFSIYAIFIFGVSPVYYANRYAMRFSSERNTTIFGLVYTEDRMIVEQITFAIYNVFLPFSAYATVIICTITLVVKLRKKAKWRLKCTASNSGDITFDRDQKVARIVLMISILFIACFVPLCLTFIAMLIEPKISLDGEYKNTLVMFGGLSALLEAANSSTNIFIYFYMSSSYRMVFCQLFLCQKVAFH